MWWRCGAGKKGGIRSRKGQARVADQKTACETDVKKKQPCARSLPCPLSVAHLGVVRSRWLLPASPPSPSPSFALTLLSLSLSLSLSLCLCLCLSLSPAQTHQRGETRLTTSTIPALGLRRGSLLRDGVSGKFRMVVQPHTPVRELVRPLQPSDSVWPLSASAALETRLS